MSGEILLLHESGPLLAVNKPAGLLTQAPPGIDSAELRVKTLLKARDARTGNVYLAVPHRIDRPASGVLVLARHVRAARRICEQFEARLVRKVYWVCVEGEVTPEVGSWEDWMIKVPEEPRGAIVAENHPGARQALLRYRVIGRQRWGSWLEIELETGRTHQIRVQAAARGWPVVGDAMYGAKTSFGPPQEDPRLRPIALHAQSLGLRHPMTHEALTIEAPLAATWDELELRREAVEETNAETGG